MTIKKITALSFGSFFIAGVFCFTPVEGTEKTIKEENGFEFQRKVDDLQDPDPKFSKALRIEPIATGYRVTDLRTQEGLVYNEAKREVTGTSLGLMKRIASQGILEKDSGLKMQVQFEGKISEGLLTTLQKKGYEISRDQKTVFAEEENIKPLIDYISLSGELFKASPRFRFTDVSQGAVRASLYGDKADFQHKFTELKEKEHVAFTHYEGGTLTVDRYDDGSIGALKRAPGLLYFFDYSGNRRVFTNDFMYGKKALDILKEKNADVGVGVNLKFAHLDNDKDLVAYFKKANIHYHKTREGSWVIIGAPILKAQETLDYVSQFGNNVGPIEFEIKDLQTDEITSLKEGLEGYKDFYPTGRFYPGQRNALLASGPFEDLVERNETWNTEPVATPIRPREADVFRGDANPVLPVDTIQTDAVINPGNSGGPLVSA